MSPRFYLGAPMMLDRLFVLLWHGLGLLVWPWLWIYPRSRRHLWRVHGPTPGRTWVHGASIGEHRNADALRGLLGPTWKTHSSWRSQPHGSFPAPMDLPFVIGPWLNRTRPSRLILLEGELWPGWLIACRIRGIPVVVLAARKGPGWKRWQWVPMIFEWLTRDVAFIHTDQLGDLKRLATPPKPLFEIPEGTIVGASTRPGDEKRLLDAWEKLDTPRPKLILAPRHLHRVDAILALVQPHRASLRSNGLQPEDDIWILDTHGELAGVVAHAHIVMIGGTFDPDIGGHSPAEAALGHAHLIRGPYTAANATTWQSVISTEVESVDSLHRSLQIMAKQAAPKQIDIEIDLQKLVDNLPEPVAISETFRWPWLWPLVPCWQALSALFRRFQRGQPNRSFVVVGGLVNGGAGRTPAAAWLAQEMNAGHVVSAGYRRRRTGPEIRQGTPDQTPPCDLGDELEMMRRRGLTVTSDPNRINAINQMSSNQIPIIDGGLGDPRLRSGFRIACIDGRTPMGRGPFPVGSRRLPWSTLDSVDAIWIANPSSHMDCVQLPRHVPTVRSSMHALGWIHKGTLHPLDAVQGSVDVVVGIANPERFVCTLVDLGLHIRTLRVVGDHDPLGTVAPNTVLTEKDAARLPEDADVWALRMGLEVTGGDALLAHIAEHCA